MAEAPLLRDLVVLFATSLPIVYAFQKLRVPAIAGYLVAGVVLGPHGAKAIATVEDVNRLAELGVVLLLFAVGLELSFGSLVRLGARVLVIAAAQLVLTAGAVTAALALAGLALAEAVLMGFLVVHSSTAIALKVLADRGQTDAPQGRVSAGILLFQDLALVPMMLLVPVLAARGTVDAAGIARVLGQAALVVVGIVVAARLLLPAVLHQVARLRIREVFTATIVLFCLGTAWLAGQFGLSLAVGALIAGLVISESEYSFQVFAEVLPFRDAFHSIFFISVGMLLHLDFLLHRPLEALAGVAGLLLLKGGIITGLVALVQRSVRVALITGVCLAQVGELAFVLARFALPLGLLPSAHYEAFLAVAVLSMLCTPLLVGPAERAAFWLQERCGGGLERVSAAGSARGHVVIVGYGLNGQNLARVLRETGISYAIVELNPDAVRTARAQGQPIVFGDASRAEVLQAVGVERAHVIVVAISDPFGSRRITALARKMNPTATIIVRTRYVSEIDDLYALGASEVIPEEFETSVEIFARVLRRVHVPRNVIGLQVDLIRRERYGMLRGLRLPQQSLLDVQHILAATLTETFLVQPESPAAGRTIGELQLRRRTGATVIAVVRDGKAETNPGADWQLRAGDVLVLVGNHQELDRALSLLGPPGASDSGAGRV